MSVIRYTSYTNAQAIAATDLPGTDIALQAVQVITPTINAAANAIVFTLKGAGTIKAVMSAEVTSNVGATRITTFTITITPDGKSLNFAVPGGGTVFANTDMAYLLLAVGY